MKRQTREEYVQRWAMTEALRQAKETVKHQIKCQGLRVADFAAKEITLRAWALIEADREAAIAQAVARLIGRYERQ
ncbi:MAG: hypothetical protein WCD69_14165 [Xanthobacteraceae bacterium]